MEMNYATIEAGGRGSIRLRTGGGVIDFHVVNQFRVILSCKDGLYTLHTHLSDRDPLPDDLTITKGVAIPELSNK